MYLTIIMRSLLPMALVKADVENRREKGENIILGKYSRIQPGFELGTFSVISRVFDNVYVAIHAYTYNYIVGGRLVHSRYTGSVHACLWMVNAMHVQYSHSSNYCWTKATP